MRKRGNVSLRASARTASESPEACLLASCRLFDHFIGGGDRTFSRGLLKRTCACGRFRWGTAMRILRICLAFFCFCDDGWSLILRL